MLISFGSHSGHVRLLLMEDSRNLRGSILSNLRVFSNPSHWTWTGWEKSVAAN